MKVEDFKFHDGRNVAVFTVKQIFKENNPILYVSHDEEDRTWQFLTDETVEIKDAMIVSLEEIVVLDPTVNELYDLPMGHYAERKFIGDNWVRKTKE